MPHDDHGFHAVHNIVDEGYDQGNYWHQAFRKVPAIASTAGSVVDLSMAPGSPKPNYYTGAELTATEIDLTRGIWHGGDVSPKQKHLHMVTLQSVTAAVVPAKFWLLDYLMFYPLVDMDSTDEQFFDNTLTLSTLTSPRYTDGYGVQAFLVATNPYVGGAYFTMTYVNHLGETKYTKAHLTNTYTTIGTVVHSGPVANIGAGAFIELNQGDYIRSATSITFFSPNGGLAALVLAAPIAHAYLREITAPAETDFLTMRPLLPQIHDGAYLNMLCSPNGSVAAAPIIGSIQTIWN